MFETPVNPAPAGSYMPIRRWLHYADPRLAPTCRSRRGSYTAVGDTELIGRIAPTRLEGINLRGVFRFPIERYAAQLLPSQTAARTSASG